MNEACTVSGERYYYRFEEIEGQEQAAAIEVEAPASLDNYSKPPVGDARFWRRQFGVEVTQKQRKFDWSMGVVFPLLCFYFDPIVFRSWGSGEGLLMPNYQYPAYLLAFLAIMANMAWLLWGKRLGPLAAVVALILAPASFASLIIGIILFPFSLLGTLMLIGVMGFTPLMSAVVYGRNAVRAMRTAGEV